MNQQIINGIDKLPQILKDINCKKLFLVVDSSFPFLNIKDTIEALEVEKVSFSDFTPNPLYEQVCKGIDLLKAEACDAILAVGGGSAIDVAKCIKLAILADEGNNAIIPPLVNTRVACDGTKLPFIAIPTTAGTGSESTHNAVMYYEGSKQTVTNDGVLPDYTLLEPSVLKTLPLYQKKCTMMDALCQGIESWWSVNSTVESYEYSRKAIELIMQNWRAYIFDNDDEAANNIMLGANYGGRAINITATTAAHAMSYKITSLYKLPHGHAVAVGLPEIWQYMIGNMDKCIDPRGSEYLAGIFHHIANAMGCETPESAIAIFRQMMVDMDLKNPEALDRDKELETLSTSVNPIRLKNNPVGLDVETIGGLYDVIVKGAKSKIGIIIQARMGSTRLPGKILKQFYGGKTLLETLLDNLHKVEGAKVIVATSVNENNDQLESFLNEKGELVFRGSENDVLDRFIKAAESNNVDGIIRICSDNPFMDWHGVAQLADKAKTSDADYIGFRINGKPSILTHFGFWGEYVTLNALKRVAATTDEGTPAHEHVTYHIYNHPDEYKCEWIAGPDFLEGRDDIRLTIDTPEDLVSALKVYSDLKAKDDNFTLSDVVDYLDAHEEIKLSMLKIISQNVKK